MSIVSLVTQRCLFLIFLQNRRASVAIIFALAAIPAVILTGMAIDYSNAVSKRTRLNAIADSAALAAVTPAMMMQSTTIAQTTATNMFTSQVVGTPTLVSNSVSSAVSISTSGPTRVATVDYTAQVSNAFGGILGMPYMTISGHAQARSATGNIDFYLLVDTSPSMAVPASTKGIQTMIENTPEQGGCAFACHESNPGVDNLGNRNNESNYSLARSLGLTLRIDRVEDAVRGLVSTAQTVEGAASSAYRVAIYTFDVGFNKVAALSSNLSAVQGQAANIQLLEVSSFLYLTRDMYNQDADTNWDDAINAMNKVMPNPGNGGPTPAEVLIVITDGVSDELVGGSRIESVMNTSMCKTIKNRNILIAVLYTEYLPLPFNANASDISSFQPTIADTLRNCASPDLFFQVSVDQDISAALSSLFKQAALAAGTARLSQ
jgi:Flp pilus assembly protein TadG